MEKEEANEICNRKFYGIKESILRFINVALLLLILNLAANNFGLFSYNIFRALAFFTMIGMVLTNIPLDIIPWKKKGKYSWGIFFGIFFIISSILILIIFDQKLIGMFSVPIFIFGLDIFMHRIGRKRHELFLLFITSFSYGLLIMFIENIPFLWKGIQTFSIVFSQLTGLIFKPLVLGPSASGCWIFLSFIIFYIIFLYYAPKKVNTKINFLFIVSHITILLIVWIIYLFILGNPFFNTSISIVNSQYILFFLFLIPTFLLINKYKIEEVNTRILDIQIFREIKRTKKLQIIALIFLLFYAGIILNTFPYGSGEKGMVSIYKPGLGALDVPEYGKYGQGAYGFFGLFPYYLNIHGYPTMEIDNITEDTLNKTDVLVLINVNQTFAREEHLQIWDFVKKGGSLLILGDHTNISGIMTPLNNLLKPVGISYRFDSALPLKNHWVSCLTKMHHPITENIKTDFQVGISVGASLNISGFAFPIIIGKYSFSDWGDSQNMSNAFLGDYAYNPGEQLGDLILVAGCYYGKGKVIVFGDTSTFQNPSLPYSHSMIPGVFTWLTNNRSLLLDFSQVIISLIALTLSILLYIRYKKRILVILFPLILCVSLIVTSFINPILLNEDVITGPIAYIDSSHGEQFNIGSYTDKSVDGLMLNLARNGYLPVVMRDFSEKKLFNSKIIVLIAPTQFFSKKETDSIKEFIWNGGLLIISTGYPDRFSSTRLLKEFGMDVYNIPLGPVPYIEESYYENVMNPRFVDCYPILCEKDNVSVFYQIQLGGESYKLIVFKQYGDGGILLIGDNQFLLNKNLESLYDYWPGNIKLIKDIMDELRNRGVPR